MFEIYKYIHISTWQQLGTLLVRKKKIVRLWHLFTSMRYRLPEVNHFSYTQLCVLSSLSKEFTRLRKREIEKRIRDAAGVVTFREISVRLIKKRDCFSRSNSMKSEKYDICTIFVSKSYFYTLYYTRFRRYAIDKDNFLGSISMLDSTNFSKKKILMEYANI